MSVIMTPPPVRKSLWIPGLIIGAFVTLFIIEANFIVIAVHSRSGLVNDNPYLQGVHYNDTLAEQAREQALGWKISIGFVPSGSLKGTVKVSLTDQNEKPLDGALDVTALRITDQYQAVPLTVTAGDAPLSVNVPGRWFIKVVARHGADHVERTQEIFVQP